MKKMEPKYKKVNFNLVRQIMQHGGEDLRKCMQCAVCTAGCVVARYKENFSPRRIIMKACLGLDEILEAEEPWYCAVCYLCTEYCPRGVKPSDILIAIKNVAALKGLIPGKIIELNRSIIKTGRLFEFDDFVNFERKEAGLEEIKSLDKKEIRDVIGDTSYYKILER
jgi:heterodisulfide reductase subunit C